LAGPDPGIAAIGEEVAAVVAWRPTMRLVHADVRVEACGGDAGCLAEELAPLGVAFGLLIVINTEVDPPLLAMRVLDVERRAIAAEAFGPIGSSLETASRARAEKVLDAMGLLEAGRIVVKSDGAISIVPAPIRSGDDGYWVVPGRHRVSARWGDRVTSEDVVITAREERTVVLAPFEERSLVESPWLWIGVAAGAAAIAAGVVAAVLVRSGTDVCLGPPDTDCPP
jgi:hypothetical protein